MSMNSRSTDTDLGVGCAWPPNVGDSRAWDNAGVSGGDLTYVCVEQRIES